MEVCRGCREALGEAEVIEVEAHRPILADIDHVLPDRVGYSGSPYGANPLSLYLPGLTLKPV